MKITAVDVSILEVPSQHQMALQYPRHRMVVAEVRTDEGIDGLGYSLLFGGRGDKAVFDHLTRHLTPIVLGQDPTLAGRLWQLMYDADVTDRDHRAFAYAVSTLDIAIWDITAKTAGMPLACLWGANRTQVPCYGSGGWATYSLTDLIQEAERYVALGCTHYKLKAHDPDPMVNRCRVEAVATALGPAVRLMVDINQRGDVESNRRLAQVLADLDLFWYEEPVPADDIASCAEVASSIAIPVATGENNLTRYEFREIIDRGAARYLMPDVCRAFGYSEALRIGHLATAADVFVAPHLVPELSVQLAAALPSGLFVEFMDWLPSDVFEEAPRCEAGVFKLPERPGHGVSLTSAACKKYRIR